MTPIVLEEHKNLFRDEQSYEQFVQLLASVLGQDMSLIMSRDQVLGAILSPEATKEVLYDRIIRKVSSSPSILEDLRDRIENDEIVD